MYKVWVLAYGEINYATNGLEFNTIEDAIAYANDLLSRWFGAKEYAILPNNLTSYNFTQCEIDAFRVDK